MGRCVLHPLPGGSPPPVSAGPHRINRIKRWKAAHKPGSVHRHRARGLGGGGDHLSGTAVTGGLERHWIETERDHGQPLFRRPKPWPCSQPGFTEPAPLDAAGALLPHPCTLTCAAGGARPAGSHRRCVSVALSSRSPAPGVTRQAWPSGSPDFPQPAGAPPWPRPGNPPPIAITSAAFQSSC